MTDAMIDVKKEYLTADDILSAKDTEYAEIPAWGKTACIRSLTANDMIDWREANEGEAKKTAGLRLIIRSLVDKPNGVLLLKDGHLEMLRTKSEKHNNAIIAEILKLNGMETKAAETAKNA